VASGLGLKGQQPLHDAAESRGGVEAYVGVFAAQVLQMRASSVGSSGRSARG